MALQDRTKLLRALANLPGATGPTTPAIAFVDQLGAELDGKLAPIDPLPATPVTLGDVIALLQSYGMCE